MEEQSKCLQSLWKDVEESAKGPVKDSMFNIEDEFKILEKIKNIMEELHMLINVADQQQTALRSLEAEQTGSSEAQMFAGARTLSDHRGSSAKHSRRSSNTEDLSTDGKATQGPSRTEVQLKKTSHKLERAVLGVKKMRAALLHELPPRGRISPALTENAIVDDDDDPVRRVPDVESEQALEDLLLRAESRMSNLGKLLAKAKETYDAVSLVRCRVGKNNSLKGSCVFY